jgi:hypothetical protein
MRNSRLYYKLTTTIDQKVGGSINQNFYQMYPYQGQPHPLHRSYWVGKTVTAWKSTPGIFFFKTLEDTVHFARTWSIRGDFNYKKMTLFLVQPIGPVKKMTHVLLGAGLVYLTSWLKFSRFMQGKPQLYEAPQGTYVAHAVRVIERMPDAEWKNHCMILRANSMEKDSKP